MAQVGKATVAFEADTSQVTGELSSSMGTALKEVSKAVENTMTKVEGDFGEAGGALADGVEAGGAKATKSAGSASAKISGAFERAAAEASAALDDVDGDGFAGVSSQASTAASSVQSSISDAAARASAALDDVDGDAFNNVAADASAASSTISSRIPEAARRARDSIQSIGRSATEPIRAIGSRIPEAAGRAKESIKEIGRNAKKTWDDAEVGAFNFMGTLGKVAGAAAALAGPAVVVQKGWARLTSIDEARAKLTALGNSAEDVELIMDNAMESVTGTAFGFGDAAGQAATLVAAGIEPGEELERVLGLVADSAAVAGVDLNEMGSIFGKVAAGGKLSGEEMAQLLDRQIGLLPVLAEQYGVSSDEMKKMVSDGKVGFEDFTQAMETMMGGGAEKMGKTVRASFQNVGAAAGRLGEALLMPIFQAAPGFLAGITAGLGKATDAVKVVAEWFAEGSLTADLLKASFIGLGSAAVIGVLVGNLGKLQGVMTSVLGGLKALNAGFILTGPGLAIAAIVGVVAAFVLLWKRSEAFRDFWIGIWDGIVAAVQPAVDFVQEKFGLISAAWNELTAAFTGGDDGYGALWDLIGGDNAETLINKVASVGETLRDVRDFAQGVGDILFRGDFTGMPFGIEEDSPIVGILFTVRDAVMGVWDALKGAGESIGSSVWQTMVSVFEAFVSIGQAVWEAFKAIAGAVWNLIQALAPILLPILKVVGAILGGVILAAIFLVIGALHAMAWVWKMVAKVIEVFANVISWLVQNILAPLISIVAKVAAVLINVLAGAFTWLSEKVSAFIDWVGPALSSFWDGITEAWATATEWLGNVFSALWEGLQAAWEAVGQPVVDFIVAAFNFLWEAIQLVGRLIGATFEVMFTALGKAWEAWGQPVVDWVVQAFQWMGDKIRMGFDLLLVGWNILWEWMQLAWQTVGQPIVDGIVWVFQSFWNGLQIIFGWVRTGWDMLWNGMRAVYDTVIAPVIGWIVDKFNWLRDMINYALIKVRGYIDMVSFKVRLFWHEYVQPMIDNVVDGFNRMMDKIKGWKDNVIGWFADAGSWLVDAGKNIVQGLIDGATSLLSRLGEFFLDALPGWVKDPFKKALGIHSPSRVFAEYGQNIGQGLVDGVQSMSQQVQAATSGLAEGAQAGFDATTIAPAISTPAPAVGAAAGDVGADLGLIGMASAAAPAMEQMGAAITGAKETTIDPALLGIAEHMTGVGSNFLLNASEVINPAVTGMGMHLATTRAAVIDPTMWGIESHLGGMAGQFMGNIGTMINPAVSSMGTHLNNVKVGLIDPAFAGIRSGLSYVVGAFANGARDVGIHMQTLRRNTADPVRFTMNTIFSDGLVEMWNSVSDLIGTKKMGKKIAHFATGGFVQGPGGPTDDKIPAMLSNREYVINAKAVERIGVSNLDALNYGNVSVGRGAFMSRTAAQSLMNDATFQQVASRYAGGGVVKGSPAWKQLQRGYVWAQQLSGRPYVLGGDPVNGGGTDCSGYMSSIADRIGGGPGHRQWATMAFNGGGNTQQATGPQGFVKGLAAGFSIGVTNGGMYGGHTAGTIGGVEGLPATNVESGGSPSRVKFGAGAVGANDSYFRTHYHLPLVNDAFVVGSGSGGASMAAMVAEMIAPYQEKIKKQAAAWSAKPGLVNDIPAGVADRMGGAMDKTIKAEAEKMLADPGGSGAERWRPMAIRAMQRVGFNWRDPAQINAMIAQIQSESGGIPNRNQEIVDVNGTGASAGQGLLQIIPGTFAAHRDPALPNDRTDPFANMVAALRYYKSRYGMDLTTMWGHGHGYHDGGLLPDGQGMFAKTALGRERVLSPRQTAAFEDLVATLDSANMPRISPARERGEGTGSSLRTREVHVTQNIYSNDAKGAADRASDRLTSLII